MHLICIVPFVQDACPGGQAALAERDDSLRQHYGIFNFMSFGHAALMHYTI